MALLAGQFQWNALNGTGAPPRGRRASDARASEVVLKYEWRAIDVCSISSYAAPK